MLTKTKLSLTDFNPDVLFSFPDTVQMLELGVVFGAATGLVERTMPNDEVFTGLKGNFEIHFTARPAVPAVGEPGKDGYIPAQPELPVKEARSSGVLYLGGDAFQGPIEDLLSDEVDPTSGEVTRPAAAKVEIAYRVFAQRDANARKRTWVLRPLIETKVEMGNDPLANLRSLALPAPAQPTAIEDQSGEQPVVAAAETAPAAAKKK